MTMSDQHETHKIVFGLWFEQERKDTEDKDAQAVRDRLRKAQVHALVMRNYIPVSPSVFNDLHDVDNLLNALS